MSPTRKGKVPKAKFSEPNVWDQAAALEVWRGGEKLNPGVNYFVLMLNQMGFQTRCSSEGQPEGFYITFFAPYEAALEISQAGFFPVQVEGKDFWSLRSDFSVEDKIDALRWGAQAWEERFGPLDFESATLVA